MLSQKRSDEKREELKNSWEKKWNDPPCEGNANTVFEEDVSKKKNVARYILHAGQWLSN